MKVIFENEEEKKSFEWFMGTHACVEYAKTKYTGPCLVSVGGICIQQDCWRKSVEVIDDVTESIEELERLKRQYERIRTAIIENIEPDALLEWLMDGDLTMNDFASIIVGYPDFKYVDISEEV